MSTRKQGLFILPDGQNLTFTFILVSSLFFLWALCNGMIDVMDRHFQEELNLSKAQSAWVQFAHYLGYFLMSMPAGWLATRLGYKRGIITGLLIVAVGGFWFLPATHISALARAGAVTPGTAFLGFLAGVCVIATGLTFLETIANPYTTVLGDPRYAATRINLAQSCNGLGWIFGPPLGGIFFYSKDAMGRSTGSQTLYIPYLGLAIGALVIATIFAFARVPDIKTEDTYHLDDNGAPGASHSIWSHPHFVLAVAAQFFYVAAQAGIFSFFINYMTAEVPPLPASWTSIGWLGGWFETAKTGAVALSDKGAANLASVAFGCFLLGRITGSALLRKASAHKVLGLYGLMNVIATVLVFLKLGWLSVACVFASYFFMSIMFPTIFALGIYGLGARAKKASAFIVMAIMGGAVLPKLMGYVADKFDMSRGFIVPAVCFVFVAFYGFNWPKFSKADSLVQSGKIAVGH
ncbi:MAG TPA: sugar MFS transporter [Bryobacteraceae bacterium]|jgi:FHS family L-fucose permease-like MFS transporter|nr:sugar MFS transporter [Bryobacteraceae bacterium]